ncbi:sulfatase-like hydrolase/transferase [Thalassotalea sp. PLHSN55]|uniref:sulfatase-like hydrolase/transferase n=1 Tax=Thalassotalea sp. PLHSN55 TaxID=3435888 RepID=UPI003F86532E
MKLNSLLILLFVALPFSSIGKEQQPNIILLFSDDAGYGDFSFQRSIKNKQVNFNTPNLDRLASQGAKFEQAYVSAAVCGPSRAGLITGKYQQKFGFEENNVPGYMSKSGLDYEEMGLPLDQVTMAERLKNLGYKTAIFGKWHLGEADRFHPLKRGFDEFVGFRNGARSYFEYDKKELKAIDRGRKLEYGFGHYQETPKYMTDFLAAQANDFIARNQDRPFFAFVSFNAVHTPMEAHPDDLLKVKGLSGKRRTLAAMTLSLDRAVGKIIDNLEKLGLDDNTLIVFTNDNGGPSDSNLSDNFPLSGTKANHLEGGIRVPFIARWPGKIKANSRYEKPISTLDLLPTFVYAAGGTLTPTDGVDGVNLMPFLTGEESGAPHEYLFWKKEVRAAIRAGDWKLLRYPDRPAELYNIANDQQELHNLAYQYPGKVRKLYKKIFEWELTLERPLWQLKREYEGKAMVRMDTYRPPVTHKH